MQQDRHDFLGQGLCLVTDPLQFIKRIRRKFETADPSFNRIEAVYGIGYRWKSAD